MGWGHWHGWVGGRRGHRCPCAVGIAVGEGEVPGGLGDGHCGGGEEWDGEEGLHFGEVGVGYGYGCEKSGCKLVGRERKIYGL